MSVPFDINTPVPEGSDYVLNNDDGTQSMGTADEFEKAQAAGTLSGVHTDPAGAPHNGAEPTEVGVEAPEANSTTDEASVAVKKPTKKS